MCLMHQVSVENLPGSDVEGYASCDVFVKPTADGLFNMCVVLDAPDDRPCAQSRSLACIALAGWMTS